MRRPSDRQPCAFWTIAALGSDAMLDDGDVGDTADGELMVIWPCSTVDCRCWWREEH